MRSNGSQSNSNINNRISRSGSQILDEIPATNNLSTGIANIPNQVHYIHSKRKLNINVLLFGENRMGKIGFMNQVLGQPIFNKSTQSKDQKKDGEAIIRIRSQEIDKNGTRALLSVVDLPNFGTSHGKQEAGKATLAYLEDQFELSLRQESQFIRQVNDSRDSRIHSVLYFHNPTSHKLSQLDLELIGEMTKLSNVLIVIAKGDTLLRHEYLRIKNHMRDQLNQAGIKVFQASDKNDENDQSPFEPFICVSGVDLLSASPARNYSWGSLKVAPSSSPASLNINSLTNLLFRDFLPDLIQNTQEMYAAWKVEFVRKAGVKEEEWNEPTEVLNKIVAKMSQLKMNA